MSDGMDVLVVGIDAGCLPVFERLSERGAIPNIDAIRGASDGADAADAEPATTAEGAAAPLQSQIPPWTPSAWPSIYTGVNPGKHGATGFVEFDGYDWSVVTANDVTEHAIWNVLDERGYASVVVNAPVTHPPDEIDGAIVPGFIGPEDPACHPPGTLEEIRDAIGEYRVYPNYTRDGDDATPAEKRREYRTLARMRGEAFRYLCDVHDPDFGFLQFQRTDTVFHEFNGDPEMVEAVYDETDRQIGAVLDHCDPDTVFLVSDHGMGHYDEYEFRVNEFLAGEGYVETTMGGKGMPGWAPIRDDLKEGEDVESWEPNVAERLAAKAAEYGVTASRIRRALEAVNLADVAKQYAPKNVTRTGNKQVDFENSMAYLRSRTELGVRINLEGREPNGVVLPSAYDDVRAELIEKLRGVETPDGEPLFETVAPREEYFHGPHEEDAPDIVLVPNDFRHFLSDQLRGEQFVRTDVWNHKRDGVFAATGRAVDVDAMPDHPHIFDVAPTVLSAMGVPYSDRTDGEPLPIVRDAGAQAYREYGATATVETEAGQGVEDRLADLGYLD